MQFSELDSVLPVVTFRNFVIAVALSILGSVGLALAPVLSPATPPLPLIAINWMIWMLVAVVFRRSRVDWVTHAESVWWDRLTGLAIVAFIVAGFFALFNAETMIAAGDIAQLR